MPEGVEHTWLLRHGTEPGTPTVLQDALTSTEWWPGTPFAWVAGGAATLAALRRWLRNREGPGPRADGGHRVLEAPIHDGLRGPRSPRRPRRARQPCGVRPERARARAARRASERGPGPGWRGGLGGDHGQFLPARGGPRGRRRPLGQGADPRGPGGPPRARGALRPGAARAAGHGARGTRRAGGPAPSARAPPPDRPRTPAGRRGVRFPRRTAGVLRRGGPGHGAHPRTDERAQRLLDAHRRTISRAPGHERVRGGLLPQRGLERAALHGAPRGRDRPHRLGTGPPRIADVPGHRRDQRPETRDQRPSPATG